MIDLVTGKTCDSLEDYPVGTLGGTGALLDGLYPLVCGGYVSERPNTNQCKILGFSGEYVSIAYNFHNTASLRNLNFCAHSVRLLRKLNHVLLWILSNDTGL